MGSRERKRVSHFFSPGGRWLAAGSDPGVVTLSEVATPIYSRDLQMQGSSGYRNVFSVAFSPDGRRLAAANQSGNVTLWNLDNTDQFRTFTEPESEYSVAFSTDGALLAVGGASGKTSVWDIATGEFRARRNLRPATSHGTAYSVAFNPVGHGLAVGYSDGAIVLWNLVNGKESRSFEVPGPAGTVGSGGSVAFSPDGHLLASAHGRTVILWDAASGDQRHVFAAELSVASVSFSPDGRWLAAGCEDKENWLSREYGYVRLWRRF